MGVLVLGKSGQLASHLRETIEDATYLGRDQLDLADPRSAEASILEHDPDFIVNAAAYTAVDRAESEPLAAWRINAEAVAAAAKAARALDVPFVHVSTDFVFDGRSDRPYRVDDPTRPINVYGMTKLGGELAAAAICPKHWILRTSWVFSEHGFNFVKTMLRLAKDSRALRVVHDQKGVPTYAGQLAEVIAGLVSRGDDPALPWGTYHAVGGPITSWHGFASTIFDYAGKASLLDHEVDVEAIPASEYPTPAKRPANSSLEPSADFLAHLGVSMDWTRGLQVALTQLGKT